MRHFLKLLFAMLIVVNELEALNWSYTGKNDGIYSWYKLFPSCDGTMQSPIAINKKEMQILKKNLKVNLFVKPGIKINTLKYNVQNNGHTIQITIPPNTWFVSYHGTANQEFEVMYINFHWGSSNSHGSEHMLDSKQFSFETHVVSYNKQLYKNANAAMGAPNGLSSLGFWNSLNEKIHTSLTQIGILGNLELILPKLVKPNSSHKIEGFNLTKLMTQVDVTKYYRYSGSLTAPPCTENVMWTIFQKAVPITTKQITHFRKLQFPKTETLKTMGDNYRPVQTLNPSRTNVPRIVYTT